MLEVSISGSLNWYDSNTDVNGKAILDGTIPDYIDAGMIREVPETQPKQDEYELTKVTETSDHVLVAMSPEGMECNIGCCRIYPQFAGFLSADKEEMFCDPMWRTPSGNLVYAHMTPITGCTLVRPGFVRWIKR